MRAVHVSIDMPLRRLKIPNLGEAAGLVAQLVRARP